MFKVKVSDLKPNDRGLKIMQKQTELKIKKWVNNHSKFATLNELIDELKIPIKYFEFRFVCFGCGEVTTKATYAIAQNAMGNEVIYTCECSHKTKLR